MRSWWFRFHNPLCAALALAGLSLGASPAAAQARIEFGPSIGVYAPLGGWTHDFGGDEVERRHIVTGLVSARVAYWPGGRFGVAATVGYAPSPVAVTDLSGTADIGARVVLSSVRVQARLLTFTEGEDPYTISHWSFHAGAGVGLVHHGGTGWANQTGTTHPAAVLALDARTGLAGRATLRLAVEDYVSWVTFNSGRPAATRPKTQHDLVGTVAVLFRLRGRH